ncbi:hypothetical protein MLD38_039114 [Melastoma candidum]|uniref:Uncharacterized protein n=1 Tax=Melastoma candidum TaxID=119954 RepID=A0ACB9L1D2_9MYRT|nr:hypothetical protein MLD38_039114 [Melastoma candidum]
MMPSSLGRGSGRDDEIGGSEVWEVRPGGMLVQSRSGGSGETGIRDQVPPIRVRVKYGSAHHEVSINPRASFGELKKMLMEPSGLHHEEQKLIYKKRERSSRQYLDVAGVKNGSKVVLVEDVASRERRSLEMLTAARREKAAKSLAEIDSKVQKCSQQVLTMMAKADEGGEVEIREVDNLTAILMTILVKLDGMIIGGDQKLMKNKQEKKVQELVETLDKLKLPANSTRDGNRRPQMTSSRKTAAPVDVKDKNKIIPPPQRQQQQMRNNPGAVITTKWETFE